MGISRSGRSVGNLRREEEEWSGHLGGQDRPLIREMWSVSVSLEIYGHMLQAEILYVLSGHVQLFGHRLRVGLELGLLKAVLVPNESS